MDSLLAIIAQSETKWLEIFNSPYAIFVIGGAIAITAIVATQLRGYSESKNLTRLKSEMVQRGFSAEEITQVIESGRGTPAASKQAE